MQVAYSKQPAAMMLLKWFLGINNRRRDQRDEQPAAARC
jgi:hypothetical protein